MKWLVIKGRPAVECDSCRLLWTIDSILEQLFRIEEEIENSEIYSRNDIWNFFNENLHFRNRALFRLYHSLFYVKSKNIAFKLGDYEISHLLNVFSLPHSYKTEILIRFEHIWNLLNPVRVYKDPQVLAPLVLYLFCRFNDIPINTQLLIEKSKITEAQFSCFIFQLFEYFINYLNNDIFDLSLQEEFWYSEFNQFLTFLDYYRNCCIYKHKTGKRYMKSLYFSLEPEFKQEIIQTIFKRDRCTPDDLCIFNVRNNLSLSELEAKKLK